MASSLYSNTVYLLILMVTLFVFVLTIIFVKVGNKSKLYNLHQDDDKSTYHAVAMLEVPLKPGCMPVKDKEALSNNRFKFTVKINKYW